MACGQLGLTSVQPHIGYDNLANTLESNLKMYYDWALLGIGGWSDVKISSPGAYGGDYSKLRVVDDPSYPDNTVWEAPRKDFVWETNIDYINTNGDISNPSLVGVPVVNDSLTTESYHINYPQGQVIFENPQSGTVHLAYSYRYAQIYRADDAPWFQELQFNSHRVDDAQFEQSEDGVWSVFGQHRVQMPCVVIETVPRGTSRGWELGSHSKEASRDILFHIYAENRFDRNNLMDIFNLQTDRKLPLFDNNLIVENQAWPLNYKGELVNNQGYPDFVESSGYKWNTCFMENSTITNIQRLHPSLYTAVVKTTMSVIV